MMRGLPRTAFFLKGGTAAPLGCLEGDRSVNIAALPALKPIPNCSGTSTGIALTLGTGKYPVLPGLNFEGDFNGRTDDFREVDVAEHDN